ncbi:iron ABC transporter ATP-binding protein [Candidatus Epulonipiscium fishelsonii]|uniref:Iron ABC transporter ATP-binding protein n=1 Tax=Candidatus Epulonipiscium fishelsonii TaxID=77094 RepID=A0ACC8XDQ6_9FIRM|nr:iron ABC transporter ATP-binding protein [Epulopiscium sp. SCG-B11WGA-EpuloA1]
MLKLEDLSCGYDTNLVLKGVSFNLNQGENLCVLGSNGCGKTTLIKAISGLLNYSGSIKLFDKEVKNIKPQELGKSIAVLSQNSNIYFSYTIFDTVMLGRYLHLPNSIFVKPDKTHADYVLHCLETVGIADLKDREISTLSGGQMQKVFLARALAQEPKIIILDEPSNHLDIKSQMELFTFLNDWTKDKKHTVISVLHDISLAVNFFDNGILLKDGKIIFKGNLKSLTMEDLLVTYDFDVLKYLIDLNKPLKEIYNVQKQI